MAEYKMLVENFQVDGTTGYRTYWLRVLELDDAGQEIGRGPLRGYGIDAQAFANLHGANGETFVMAQKTAAVELYQQLKIADAGDATIKGKSF